MEKISLKNRKKFRRSRKKFFQKSKKISWKNGKKILKIEKIRLKN